MYKKSFYWLLLCTSLTSCSRLDVAVRWADTFIVAKVDKYFDLNRQQSQELKKLVREDLQTIKGQLLPSWTQRLKEVRQDLEADRLNEVKIALHFSSIFKDLENIQTSFTRTATRVIASTSSSQINHLAQTLKKQNDEELEDSRDHGEFEDQMTKKYQKWFKMFLGDLEPEQSKMIRRHVSEDLIPTDLKIKNRQHLLLKFVADHANKELAQRFIDVFLNHPEKLHLEEYVLAREKYQSKLQDLICAVLGKMTLKQKKELKIQLLDKARQLEKIAARDY